jgi:hypothetical protein
MDYCLISPTFSTNSLGHTDARMIGNFKLASPEMVEALDKMLLQLMI